MSTGWRLDLGKAMEPLTTAERAAIRSLLGAKAMGLPVPPTFICPESLFLRGLVSRDDNGMPVISDEQQSKLVELGEHPMNVPAMFYDRGNADATPSAEGVARYQQHGHCEDGYYIAESGEHIPCTCSEKCDEECEGECGCEACARCAMDILHGE